MPFVKGQSGNPSGRARKAPEADPDDYDVPLWKKMRKVFGQPASLDKGHGERAFRAMLKKDPKGYVAQMVALEREDVEKDAARRRQEEAERAGVRPAESDERLLALCERLIEDLAGGA